MIIQQVIKGITGIGTSEATRTLAEGIKCKWWLELAKRGRSLPVQEIPKRLTDRNLHWHQNHYDRPDPLDPNGEVFCLHTPFISTTAGTVERDTFNKTNILNPAWIEALRFATDFWTQDGCLFYCYLLIIGRRAVALQPFSEELRELNVYTGFSPYQPEGEIAAKIIIPPSQIEKAELWRMKDIMDAVSQGRMPQYDSLIPNSFFVPPQQYNNVRECLK